MTISVRVWIVAHTQGVLDGDEAIVGIQAQHILRGEFSVYFYKQAYMGSLEAYIIALIFAIAGSSVWALRAEPTLLSLVLVWLTWEMAGTLADVAHLPSSARRLFMILTALLAAVPPLYDTIIELRTYGGFIEIFIIMLWLLLSVLRLTQRWQAGASTRELALRWAGIGFLIGLGFWIYPLVICAVLTALFWVGGYCMLLFLQQRRPLPRISPSTISPLKGLLLAVTGIPAGLLGFAPALYWGANNKWQNITYIFDNGGSGGFSRHRLATIREVARLYTTCIGPRVVDGALPAVNSTSAHPKIFTLLLVAGLFSLATTTVLFVLSFVWRHSLLLQVRHLTGLPLLFAAVGIGIFCTASISAVGLAAPCGKIDLAGRYAAPLLIALPFLFASPFIATRLYFSAQKGKQGQHHDKDTHTSEQPPFIEHFSRLRFPEVEQIGLLGIALLYLCTQFYTYTQTSPNYTFQTSGCLAVPANDEQVIAYLQRKHIRSAWGTFWMGYPIIFKTHEQIVVSDPRIKTDPQVFSSRLPQYIQTVTAAYRPSVLTLVDHNDSSPRILQLLGAQGITYQVVRIPSEPGVDLLIITPLNRTISPFTDHALNAAYHGC